MAIQVGDRVPEATFKTVGPDGPQEITTNEMLTGKKMVLFAVPGAFTPTCDRNHLPGFIEHSAAIRAKGVDEIAVVSVNDVFVMGAWAKASGAGDKVRFLADGSAEFTRAVGMELDASGFGMGTRSKRYAMVIEDGIVKDLQVEDAPGSVEKSGAAAILARL